MNVFCAHQLGTVLFDGLADGVGSLLIGIGHGLHSPLGETVASSGVAHVHIAVHGT